MQKELFQNFEVYIGDDPVYSNNPKCPGGPFMLWEDQNSFTTVTQKDASGNLITVNAWKYGVELWCNMEGQYTTIVADFSSLKG